MTIKTKSPSCITIKELMRQIKVLKIDKDATISIPNDGKTFRHLQHISYCRPLKEVALW